MVSFGEKTRMELLQVKEQDAVFKGSDQKRTDYRKSELLLLCGARPGEGWSRTPL